MADTGTAVEEALEQSGDYANTIEGPPAPLSRGSLAHPRQRWEEWRAVWVIHIRREAGAIKDRLLIGAELAAIVLWAVVVMRPYLNLDPMVVPTGREYLSLIQPHHVWTRVQQCGWCALWNGSVRGGYPAFAEPHAGILHPLVLLTTSGWGVLNGSKLTLVGVFIMAGLGRWWLAQVLGLGRAARLWSAGMAVVAGHTAGRLAFGGLSMALSTAASGLVWPPLILLVRTGHRRARVALAVMLALLAVSGQGYLQVGFIFTLPALILLVPWERAQFALFGRRLAQAMALAGLLAAPFLVPFLHFLPQFGKDIDPNFSSAQAFPFVPLNLVINDPQFYSSEALQKLAALPHHYVNFVGWIPVLFAVWALRGGRSPAERRAITYLTTVALLGLWLSSGDPLAWLIRLSPIAWLDTQLAGVRHPSFISGLAVPPVLGLAAIGLDKLLSAIWPRVKLSIATAQIPSPSVVLDLRWLLIIPLFVSLNDARVFGRAWMGVGRLPPEVPLLIEELRTPDLQWVNPPMGEHFWNEYAVSQGLKLAIAFQAWHWKDHPLPETLLEAARFGPPPGMTTLYKTVGDIGIYTGPPGREYAAILQSDGNRTICTAHGIGGNIDVSCNAPQVGVLTVKENSWSGWQARVDGRRVPLRQGPWLTVEVPPGSHAIQFRYRPWDVPLGLLLGLTGIIVALFVWWTEKAHPAYRP